MNNRRKHVTLGVSQVEPPKEGQSIARAGNGRGGNIVEVELPSGRKTLCVIPSKFSKKLWIKRNGFLIIEEGLEEAGDDHGKVTGTVVTVLYEDQVKQLKKMPGVWPHGFEVQEKLGVAEANSDDVATNGGQVGQEEVAVSDEDDDGLPPLEPNTNRRVVYHEVSDSDEGDA